MGPKDPLRQAMPGGVDRELFQRFSKACDGMPTEAVIGAAANILINALRQTKNTQPQAEAAFDELFGKMKQILVDHYDTLGRKRGIFPYDQTISLPRMVLSKR